MTMTYSSWVTQLANMMPVTETSSNFQTMLPGCIDYAEQRIYRELDLQGTRVIANGTTSSASRNVQLPATFIVIEQINAFTPPGTGTSRNQLVPVTRDYLDVTYPGATGTVEGVPQFFAWNRGSSEVVLGPFPDNAYTLEFYGTIRPTPLSSANTATILTTNYPDLWFAATMVYASAYMRDFGGQTDDPRMSQSWESQYQALKQSALEEEFRKKFQSQAWTTKQPNPIATPPRT